MPYCRDCADNDGICPGSGQPCDPANVIVEMRSSEPPFKTWRELGYLPFEMFGEKFAVTRNAASGLVGELKWRVSHVATGVAVPRTGSDSKKYSAKAARDELEFVGEEKFKAALARVRATIAEGKLPA